MSNFNVFPMIPLIDQVLLPEGILTVPLPLNDTVLEVLSLYQQFATFQVCDEEEGECYAVGCLARVLEISIDADSDRLLVTLQGDVRVERINLLGLSYEYPFALVRCDTTYAKVPLFSAALEESVVQSIVDNLANATNSTLQFDSGSKHTALTGLLPLTNGERQFLLEETDITQRDCLMSTWANGPHNNRMH